MIKPRKRLLIWGGIGMTIVVSALAAAAIVIARRAGPILKARITETLRASFHGRVDLQTVDIAAWHGFEVSGDGLRIYATNDSGTPPLVSVSHFSFHAPFFGLLFKPTHVSEVKIDGLVIDIPPGQLRSQTSSLTGKKSHDKIEVLVDEIVCDNSRLTVDNANPGKGPKVFELRHIELHNVGPAAPWRYQAQLINAIPRGEIEAAGDFGPWQSVSFWCSSMRKPGSKVRLIMRSPCTSRMRLAAKPPISAWRTLAGSAPALRGEHQRLADRRDVQRHDDLVGDLGGLAVAVAADQRDVLAHQLEQRLDAFERRLRAADHDGERSRPWRPPRRRRPARRGSRSPAR